MHRDKNKIGQNFSLTNATTTPYKGNELHSVPPSGRQFAKSAKADRSDTPPEKGSGKRDIREPESPRREDEIREPNPDEQEADDAAEAQRRESHREAAMEENPPRDDTRL